MTEEEYEEAVKTAYQLGFDAGAKMTIVQMLYKVNGE